MEAGKLHHLVVIVDGGPKIVTFIPNGVLNDGGGCRQFGWGRFSPNLREVSRFTHPHGIGSEASEALRIGPSLRGDIRALRIYYRALRTSEALGNYRANQQTQ